MQQRMAALNTRLAADLPIRIGISTGEVVADLRAVDAGEFMVPGEVVNLPARLQQAAPPDGIVGDDRTYSATRLAIQFAPLPPAVDGDFAGRNRWQGTGGAGRAAGQGRRGALGGRGRGG